MEHQRRSAPETEEDKRKKLRLKHSFLSASGREDFHDKYMTFLNMHVDEFDFRPSNESDNETN